MSVSTQVRTGVVSWFSRAKGYGFITPDATPEDPKPLDLFVHFSQINKAGYKFIDPKDVVEFVIAASDKGPQAEKVKVTEHAGQAEDSNI